jgi:hypothetical protein
MGQWEEYRKAYGNGKQYRPFGTQDRARVEGFIPGWLLELWDADGWAGYREGLLWTIDPEQFAPLMALWKPPEKPIYPVARTAFGELYCLQIYVDEDGVAHGDEPYVIAKIDPLTCSFSIPSVDDESFLKSSLTKFKYIKDVFWEEKVKRASEDLGPLEWNEMYSFDPPLAAGGSGAPDTVVKVNLFEEHKRLAKLGELKFVKY